MKSRRRPASAPASELSIEGALRRFMQQAPLPFAMTRGAGHTLVYANSAFRRLCDIADGKSLGVPIANLFTTVQREALSLLLDRAFRDGVALLDERIEQFRDGGSSLRCSIWPVIADDGHADALGIEIRESTPPGMALELQRQVAEQLLLGAMRERDFNDDVEAARRRAAFLAEAGRLLAETVDQTSTLVALTKLGLPSLGAWCIVDILEQGGTIHRLGIYHPDPEKQRLAQRLEATWLPQPDDVFGGPAMLRDGRTIASTGDIQATLVATARSAENLAILRQLGIGSFLTVPLIARSKLLGAITFVSDQDDFWSRPENVQLAEALATRGALALDNAQMFELAQVLRLKAEAANRAKTSFLGSMSHELRTPLNAIGGYIDLLDMGLRGPVTEAQHADLARVKSNQQRLLFLITEILNVVQVGSGRVSYAITDINACDMMTHAVALIEPLFGQKGILFGGVSGDASIIARGDPERVGQILANLLSNAIKFTPKGGRVSAECAALHDIVTLSISDTGIGISAEEREAIFQPFVQLKERAFDRDGGVGLGLAISRDLARGMSGDLIVDSAQGQGARFILSLPRASEGPAGNPPAVGF